VLIKINKSVGRVIRHMMLKNSSQFSIRAIITFMVIMLLFKIWLTGAQTVQAISFAGHDERLFLQMTAHVLEGNWLGDYTQMTLIKGPFYSLFIACAFLLGLPLFTAQQLFYGLACMILMQALRPLALKFWIQVMVYMLLLFNPVTYDMAVHSRVLRQNIIPALSVLVISGLIGMHLRREFCFKRLLPWALLLGVSIAAFYLTREDAIWITPALFLPWFSTIYLILRDYHVTRLRKLFVVVLCPFAVFGLSLFVICGLNWKKYGIFTTCELRHPSFKAAYGALTRIKPTTWHPYIPVARETRERIYEVSPAFAELRVHFEGNLGFNWANSSKHVLNLPPEQREIGGGWFVWALRDAVSYAGHTRSGAEAMAFYDRITKEVNAACDQGLIAAGPSRSGFLSPWNSSYNRPLVGALKKTAMMLITLEDLQVEPIYSQGTENGLRIFSDLTRERLEPVAGEKFRLIGQSKLNKIKLSLLAPIGRGYNFTLPWLGGFAGISILISFWIAWRRSLFNYWGIVSIGLLGSCVALVAICAVVDTSSFPAISPAYLTGGYGFYILFIFFSILSMCTMLVQRKKIGR
jgi:hypothetical protein